MCLINYLSLWGKYKDKISPSCVKGMDVYLYSAMDQETQESISRIGNKDKIV